MDLLIETKKEMRLIERKERKREVWKCNVEPLDITCENICITYRDRKMER